MSLEEAEAALLRLWEATRLAARGQALGFSTDQPGIIEHAYSGAEPASWEPYERARTT